MKLTYKIALLVIVLLTLSACAAMVVGGAAAGATFSYVNGWLAKDYPVSLKKGFNASLKALKHHDLRIVEKEKDVTVAFIKARGAKRDVRIRIKRKNRRITRISIRFGVVGDRKASRLIHQTIEEFL